MTNVCEMTTDGELNEAIAVEVMDWWVYESEFYGDYYLSRDTNENQMDVTEFTPTADLNQAFEVLRKWLGFSTANIAQISCFSDDYYIALDDRLAVLGESRNKNIARAICEAVLMAVRGEK